MDSWAYVAIPAAGVAAGMINTVVGSGTLITFPTLLGFGIPPLTANITNSVGVFPGSFTGAYGYRRELSGQRARVVRLTSGSVAGAIVGAVLLLVLPASAFHAIVPVLVLIGVALVIFQPRLARWLNRRGRSARDKAGPLTWAMVFVTGVYGGYFGAAQGVILLAVLGLALNDTLQRINAVKNVLSGSANAVAAVVFALVAHVDWTAAGLLAAGSIAGGVLGARVGRKLPAPLLRAIIVVVGLAAFVELIR